MHSFVEMLLGSAAARPFGWLIVPICQHSELGAVVAGTVFKITEPHTTRCLYLRHNSHVFYMLSKLTLDVLVLLHFPKEPRRRTLALLPLFLPFTPSATTIR